MLDKTYCFGSIIYTVKFSGAKVVAAVVAAAAAACSLAMAVCLSASIGARNACHAQTKAFSAPYFCRVLQEGVSQAK